MAAISKELFETAAASCDGCHVIGHPWHRNCFVANLMCYKEAFKGSTRFYTIVYLAQILMRGKKMLKDKEEWRRMLEYFARSTLLGMLVTGCACTFQCLFRALFGGKVKYHYYILIPGIISGLSIYLEPPGRRSLIINLFCNLYIEYYLRKLEQNGYITMGKYKQTLLFMVGSAALFYLMRLEGEKKQRTPLLWLFTPEKVRWKDHAEPGSSPCPHTGSCPQHILKGFSKLFGVGLAISLARVLLPKIGSPVKALSSIRPQHFKMAASFGCYIGIYRAVICYLCRKKGKDSALYAIPAGFLSGVSFAFNPSLGISIAAVTAACKLYTTILYEKGILPSNLPLPEMLYCLLQGHLYHIRFMEPDVCPKYILNLMKTVSHGQTEILYKNVTEAVKRLADK